MKKTQTSYAKHNRLAMILVCLLISTNMWGQVREVRNAPSPEVANLGSFGSIPVGHYTGTPDVSVPIYNKSRKILTSSSGHVSSFERETAYTALVIRYWMGPFCGWLYCAKCQRSSRRERNEHNAGWILFQPQQDQ